MTKKQLIGRVLLTFAIAATLLLAIVIDWTISHMVDPSWPPHARYHVLMYHGTLLIFSLAAFYWLWGPSRRQPTSLGFAFLVPLAIWVPFYPAALFPSVSVYATEEMAKEGVPINLVIGAVLLVLSVVGYYMARQQDSNT